MTIAVRAVASDPLYGRLERALEWPMAILALAVVPALILEDRATSESVLATAVAINWFVWLAFPAKLAVSAGHVLCLRALGILHEKGIP